MRKRYCLWIFLAALGAGCSPQRSFEAEEFEIGNGKLTAKGWTDGDKFGAEIRLESDDENTTLANVRLVPATGIGRQPSKWEDETPRPAGIRLGLGLGFGWLIGSRVSVGPSLGVPIPLKTGEKASRITAIDAWWNKVGTVIKPGEWTLEVDLKMVQMSGATRSRVVLEMVHAPLESGEEAPGEKVREVNFIRK